MSNLIYIAQLNPITGDVGHNKNEAIKTIKDAIQKGADIVVFPEMFLTGYNIGNIPDRYPHVLRQCKKALNEICMESKNISVLIGYPEENKENTGKPYFDSVCYINKGKIEKSIKKTSLKNLNFNIQSRIIELNGIKYGVLIGDEIYSDLEYFKKSTSESDIISFIAPYVDALLFISSSLSRASKEQFEHKYFEYISKKYKTKLIYINQTGANDEFVYGGCSRMYDEQGKITAFSKAFEEDSQIIDLISGGEINKIPNWFLSETKKDFSLDYEYDLERTYRAVIYSIKEYFSKNGFERAVLGLSGGLDSSVCAVLLSDALGAENVLGISMPSKLTSSGSKNDAFELANNLGIHFYEIPIKEGQDLLSIKFEEIFSNVNWCKRYTHSYTQDNIQARLRAMILWGVSNEYPSTLPIATSDKSESYMGYATINGDMSGGYAPILDITKTKLFALARWMNQNRTKKNVIPNNVITKPPGAELAINPKTGKTLTAEEALMPYEFLDEAIWRIENFNQTYNDMLESKFLFEKKNSIALETKQAWLEKFFKRMNSALYKGYIAAPAPMVDKHSINKAEFRHPITSKVNYKED